MKTSKSKTRLFSGMSYREVQRSNSNRRDKLSKQSQKWLKANGYRNVGWNNVTKLYQKINDLLTTPESDEPTLEELFLQAERIGNKYQTQEEIKAFNERLTAEVQAISETIDQQFPEKEVEFIDYGKQPRPVSKSKRGKKKPR
jgi:hypothetical protein